MSGPGILEEVALHVDPVWNWPFVVLVAAVLAAVLVAFPPDSTRLSAGRRATLVLLRLAGFLAVVLCMLRPTIVATQKARQRGTVLVLADASESMTVADGPTGATRWRQMADALAAAGPAARRLVATGDFDVAVWTFDREARPLPPAGDDPFPLAAWRGLPTSDETAIGAALDDGLRATSGRQLAGVLVLSDGGQHAYAPRDLPPQLVARRVADAGVPLWSVTFGQQRGAGQGRDTATVNLAVAETVYLRNELEVAGRVRLEGIAGREAVVRLLVESGSGGMQEVARTRVRATGDAVEEPVRLAWIPDTVGERKLTLRVEPQEGEAILANNELSTFVQVVDGGLRILYLEGALRVEQRFLRRVLAASPDMQVDFEWIDATRRDRWPVDVARRLDADPDVVLIGDLDSRAVRDENLRRLAGMVHDGAGLGLLGGFHAFEAGGWGGSPLGGCLPFEPDRLARQSFDEPIRRDLHVEEAVRMVPASRPLVSILRLGSTDDESVAAWAAVPPLDGANRLGRLVATTNVLAASPAGLPLLVAREVGDGRVLAFAADSTWRWTMQGAGEQHRRFWRQLVLWLARRDDVEQDSLWLRPAHRRISPGTPLPFDCGLTRPDGTSQPGVVLEATVVGPDGQRRPVRVGRQGDTFTGIVTDCSEPGDWALSVRATRPGEAAPRERSARFTVFRQDLELANPVANPLLMRQLAEATPGGVRMPEEVPAIFDEVAARPPTFESKEQWSASPWDTWPMFLLVAASLCGEWFLRKRWGLV